MLQQTLKIIEKKYRRIKKSYTFALVIRTK